MKCFKKILATALAGVLALTVLAGCSSGGFNKSEFIKQVGDYDGVTYTDVGETQAAAVEDALKKFNTLVTETYKNEDVPYWLTYLPSQLQELTNYHSDEPTGEFEKQFQIIQQELFKKLEVDPVSYDLCCYLSFASMEDFGSTHYQKSLENALAANVLQHRGAYCMTSECDTDVISYLSTQGTVSLKTITLDGKQYLLGVWKIPE